jgi:hypothetical protein
VACIMSTLEADHDVGLLGQQVDDFALPHVPPLGTNHDHIGHAAAFLRVADARDSFEATKACPAFGPSPDQGSLQTRRGRRDGLIRRQPNHLILRALFTPCRRAALTTADDLALSKAISRQDRGGDDFGFAVERHFATARRDADSAALKQFAGRVN